MRQISQEALLGHSSLGRPLTKHLATVYAAMLRLVGTFVQEFLRRLELPSFGS
jgi:hypothetical protein